jgi:hypothetical protein
MLWTIIVHTIASIFHRPAAAPTIDDSAPYSTGSPATLQTPTLRSALGPTHATQYENRDRPCGPFVIGRFGRGADGRAPDCHGVEVETYLRWWGLKNYTARTSSPPSPGFRVRLGPLTSCSEPSPEAAPKALH